jgi:hypothetical protein
MSGVVELDDVRPKRAGPILNRDFDVLIRLEVFDPGCIERDDEAKFAVLSAATRRRARHDCSPDFGPAGYPARLAD